MTTDSLFWLASMTKPITTVGALRLYEQGKLLLDDEVSAHLPALADRQVGVVDDGADPRTVRLVPAHRQPAIHDLLQHTSGIVEGLLGTTPVHELYAKAVGDGMTDLAADEFVERLSRVPLLHQPGKVWHYGWGLDLVGFIIESLSGQTLGSFLRDQIFDRLGMRDTSFGVPDDQRHRYAVALSHDPDTGLPQQLPDLSRARFDSGGAGLVGTAGDYLRFAQMLLQHGRLGPARILGRKTVEHMTSDRLMPGTDTHHLARMRFAGYGFGQGLAVRRPSAGATAPGSVGDMTWPGAGGTYWWADPREELAVVFAAHTPSRTVRIRNFQLIRALVTQALID